jgi:nanoRNase/pAp phosphatase (c-di-AMP/oligoRNAs hydrolase)
MDPIQQIISKLSESKSILIIGSGNNGDSLGASLALRSFLKKLDKDVAVLSATEVAEKFKFLPQADEVLEKIDLTKSLVMDVSLKKSQIAELSYKKEAEKLSIFLKPTQGELTPTDVTFRSSNFPYDLVVLIGIASFDQLGEFYIGHTELFFDVPLVNIDFRGSNENYGQFNLVQLSATSCSEIILDLINKFESGLVDENIATQLLAGIIAETDSFQHVRTTPQTFLKASQLVSLGAKQQEIISNLYKTKSLGLLKLWGRVLARLKTDPNIWLVYSAVNQNDLEKSEASVSDTDAIIREMVSQLGFAKIFLFLKEESNTKTQIYCHSSLPVNLSMIFSLFGPMTISPQTVKFMFPDTLPVAETKLIQLLQTEIGKLKPTL